MNPELQRYLWLELTPHRLLVTPLLLLALFALVHLLADQGTLRALAEVSYWVVLAIGVLWGGRVAGEAVSGELAHGTWDQQRLSSLGPWAMTWGKLLGAAVFTWYACAPCIVLIALGARPDAPALDAPGDALLLVTIVLFCHAIGLLGSLHLAARGRIESGRWGMLLQLAGLALAVPLLLVGIAAFGAGWSGEVRWFGMDVTLRVFVWCSAMAFTAWAVTACYRLMRVELQLRNAPWVWIAFVLFCMGYAAGFAWSGEPSAVVLIDGARIDAERLALLSAHASALGLGYLMLLLEAKDPVAWAMLLDAVRRGRIATALEHMPRWACVLPLLAAVTLAAWWWDVAGRLLCASLLVFFVRDAALVVLLNLGARPARADTAALLYLMVLYVLLPAVVLAAGGSAHGWLLPSMHGDLASAVLPGALQAALLWWLVRARWRRHQAAWH